MTATRTILLGRTADGLFWMARHIERAEDVRKRRVLAAEAAEEMTGIATSVRPTAPGDSSNHQRDRSAPVARSRCPRSKS